MAANSELIDFVRAALTRGMPRTEVEDALARAGWSGEMIRDAMGGFADIGFAIPVPRPKAYLSAREAFLYLLLFTTLYLTAYNAGSLLFDLINRAFPDPAVPAYPEYVRASVRWALSSLIVACPVFVALSMVVERSVRRDPVKRRSHVRRWLMYFTVFVAASVLMGDFITLVYNALGGELTTRFVLKVLTIATIAGTIFGYYLADLRLEDTVAPVERSPRVRLLGRAAVVAIAAVTIGGFFVSGAPAAERARRLDMRRTNDLQIISSAVEVYFQRHNRLPSSVEELPRQEGVMAATAPSPGETYEYHVTGERSYEVCATFQDGSSQLTPDVWSHEPGRQCFTRYVK